MLYILQSRHRCFLPKQGRFTSRWFFLTFFLHFTKAANNQIYFCHYQFHFITIISNSSGMKQFSTECHSEPCEESNLHRIVAELPLRESNVSSVNSAKQFCACLSLRVLAKQSDTNCHSKPCPEQGRRNSEDSQLDFFIPEFILSASASLRVKRRVSRRTCPEPAHGYALSLGLKQIVSNKHLSSRTHVRDLTQIVIPNHVLSQGEGTVRNLN